MVIYTYDNTFEGLLTCVFDSYKLKNFPVNICKREGNQQWMFAEKHHVVTDPAKAERVWKGAQSRLTGKNKQMPYYAFLSEEPDLEMKIYRFLRLLFNGYYRLETDFGDADVLYLTQCARKVKKEAMRMMQFVRFQHTRDGIWYCGIEPRYDVLPMVISHFSHRFADQQWLLYDMKRNYGAFWDKKTVEEVVLTESEIDRKTGKVSDNVLNENEAFYQTLWKSYFSHINIAERKNLRLQRQHMPKRFWKYLTEKQDN